MTPYFVGIGGGSASGKTTLARQLVAGLPERATALALDQYYRDRSDLPSAARAAQNYDAPDAFDWTLLMAHLDALAAEQTILAPTYDFATHMRRTETVPMPPHPIVIVEGLLVLSEPALRVRCALKIFIDTPPDLCLLRRLQRDTAERDRDPADVAAQYLAHVRPMHLAHVLPGRAHADLVASGEAIAQSVGMIIAAIRARRGSATNK